MSYPSRRGGLGRWILIGVGVFIFAVFAAVLWYAYVEVMGLGAEFLALGGGQLYRWHPRIMASAGACALTLLRKVSLCRNRLGRLSS